MKMNHHLIITLVETTFKLPQGAIKQRCRNTDIAEARHAYWLLAAYFGLSFESIAQAIQNDRTTGYYAVKNALNLCIQGKEYRKNVYTILTQLKEHENGKIKAPSQGLALFRIAVDSLL